MATWTISPSNPPVPQYPYQAVDVVAGVVGTPYNLPFSPQTVSFGKSPTLVLGKNGTAFATNSADTVNGPVVASFNVTSGAPTWSYQAGPSSTLSIMAVISDGSLAVNDSQNGVIQIGTNGSASPGDWVSWDCSKLFMGRNLVCSEDLRQLQDLCCR